MKYYNLSFSLKLYGIFYIKRNQSLARQKKMWKRHKTHRHQSNTTQANPIQIKSEHSSERRRVVERNKTQSNEIESMTHYLHLNGLGTFWLAWRNKNETKNWTITIFHTRNLNKRKYVIFTFLSNVVSNSIQFNLLSLAQSDVWLQFWYVNFFRWRLIAYKFHTVIPPFFCIWCC